MFIKALLLTSCILGAGLNYARAESGGRVNPNDLGGPQRSDSNRTGDDGRQMRDRGINNTPNARGLEKRSPAPNYNQPKNQEPATNPVTPSTTNEPKN